ncbi:MAG: hypothetical protein HC848_10330 [Limnobacter sp.]|nr:hypothetical protein [Limnobacter sp.]
MQFDEVTDIAWDHAGHFLVTDGDLNGLNNRLLTLNAQGQVLAHWGAPGDQPGSGPKEFNLPHALQVDACNRIWVADALNHRVQLIGSDGTYYGSIRSFNDLGVYTLDLISDPVNPLQAILFVGASPTTGGGTGQISLFRVPMNCSANPLPSIDNLQPFTHFEVPVPTSTSTTLLHSIAVDPKTWDVYLAVLGGALPPQKWVAHWPQ